MFDKLFDFNGLFGKLAPGMCRLSAKGDIAIKTSNGYKTYNVKTGKLVNCSMFCFDIGDEMFFSIPTNKVNVGDIILINRTPRCVIEVKSNCITVLNYENNTIESVVPERHVFMGNVYFYGRIMSPFAKMFGRKNGGMNKMLQFMMMSKMISGGGPTADAGEIGGQFGKIAMTAMMMGGGNIFQDMFEGMFDEDTGASFDMNDDDDDDDAEEEVPVRKPAKAKKTAKKAKED